MDAVEAVEVDFSGLPIALIRFHRSPSDAAFEKYLHDYSTLLIRDDPWVAVYESTGSWTVKSRQARRQATWIREHYDRLGQLCLGAAFAFPSPLMRGALRAIMAMQSFPMETHVCKTEAEGVAWAVGQLARGGIEYDIDRLTSLLA